MSGLAGEIRFFQASEPKGPRQRGHESTRARRRTGGPEGPRRRGLRAIPIDPEPLRA